MQTEWQLRALREGCLQIIDRLARFAETRRDLCEDEAACQTTEHRVCRSAVIELANGVVDPRDAAKQRDVVRHTGLHGCLQRSKEWRARRLIPREPAKILVAFPLA